MSDLFKQNGVPMQDVGVHVPKKRRGRPSFDVLSGFDMKSNLRKLDDQDIQKVVEIKATTGLGIRAIASMINTTPAKISTIFRDYKGSIDAFISSKNKVMAAKVCGELVSKELEERIPDSSQRELVYESLISYSNETLEAAKSSQKNLKALGDFLGPVLLKSFNEYFQKDLKQLEPRDRLAVLGSYTNSLNQTQAQQFKQAVSSVEIDLKRKMADGNPKDDGDNYVTSIKVE